MTFRRLWFIIPTETVLVAAKTLEEGIIPPTVNLDEADPECDLNYVPNEAINANPKIALSNAFGFGGINAAIVLKKYEP